jgi:hypothetical protein
MPGHTSSVGVPRSLNILNSSGKITYFILFEDHPLIRRILVKTTENVKKIHPETCSFTMAETKQVLGRFFHPNVLHCTKQGKSQGDWAIF